MAHGTHDSTPDPRNDDVLVWLNGELRPRSQATVSVLDSGFLLGDGVWEGIRVHNGRSAFLDQHLQRLYEGATAIDLEIGMTEDELGAAIAETLTANGMTDHVHIRLMVTRGLKSTPYQDPRFVISGPTIVILPEYKTPKPETIRDGISLYTVATRRGRPDVQDPKLNSHSKLNCISACIQAARAGADEALMLDPQGFVATCNSTHFFIVARARGRDREPEVWTSTGDYCLPGITRSNVIDLCRQNGLTVRERNFSLTDVYAADEAFVTGTFAGVAPVQAVDGRPMGAVSSARSGGPVRRGRGPITASIQRWYADLVDEATAE